MAIYVALCACKPRHGCEVDPAEFEGAMTRGYAEADSFKHALERFEQGLAEIKFDLVDMDWCGLADLMDWEDSESPEDTSLANDAKTSGKVVFGNFHVWEHGQEPT